MSEKISRYISMIMHPLLMPAYGFILLFNINSIIFNVPLKAKLMLTIIVLITTAILPLLIIAFIKRKGFISSWLMERKEERTFPYIITAVFYYFTYQMLERLQLPVIFYYFILGAALLIVIALITNFKWKISAHMLGAGGITGTFAGLLIRFQLDINWLVALLIIISGITGFARLKSNSHTPAQIYTGFITGAVIMSSLYIFLI